MYFIDFGRLLITGRRLFVVQIVALLMNVGAMLMTSKNSFSYQHMDTWLPIFRQPSVE